MPHSVVLYRGVVLFRGLHCIAPCSCTERVSAHSFSCSCCVHSYLDDGRHVKPEVVQKVLSLFGKYYCREASSSDGYIKPAFKLGNSTFRHAAEQRRLDAELPPIVPSTPCLHAEIAHVQSLKLDKAKPT
mmetsp:Transcript_45269/g.103893  ORF Transcript_45269/g.103893 Transcript_45269/m.103893 type:complete len:130 (+) Transcript_45269:48-437(+)